MHMVSSPHVEAPTCVLLEGEGGPEEVLAPDWGESELIWKLTPVGIVPVCPLAVMTLYAVTCK